MHLLVSLIDRCRRSALAVVVTAIFLGMFAVTYAAGHLGLSSETDLLFSQDLPWRQRAAAFKAEFPQFENLLVAVIDDPHGYVESLHQRRPYLFEELGQGERKALFDSPGPVHTWTRMQVKSLGGIPVEERRNLTDLPQAAVMSAHSLIYVPVRRDITSVMILIDRKAVQGMTVAQLAAYATMRGLSGDQAEQLEAPGETILSLFDAAAKPAELSRSDRIFLKTLYSSMPNNPAAVTLSMADAKIAEGKAAE